MHTEILAANMKINSLETDLKLFKKDYEALQKENQTFLLSIDVLKKEKEEIQIKFELSQKELFQTAENLKKIETEKESLKVETDLKISTLEKEKIELEIKIQNIEKEKIQTGFCLTEANQKLQECENKIKGYEKSSNSVNTDIVKEESLIETNKEKETESYMKLMGF